MGNSLFCISISTLDILPYLILTNNLHYTDRKTNLSSEKTLAQSHTLGFEFKLSESELSYAMPLV